MGSVLTLDTQDYTAQPAVTAGFGGLCPYESLSMLAGHDRYIICQFGHTAAAPGLCMEPERDDDWQGAAGG
jgi:hypothetical protein